MISDGTYCYEYNEANQVSKVKDCSSNRIIAKYLYDHNGKRTIKKEYQDGVLQNTTYYIGKHYETKVYSDNTTENISYYSANDERLAKKDADGNKYFFHRDHLGSTNVVTDETGNLVEKTNYYPYGSVKTGGTSSKYLYTGQEKDSETGLYYYNARYYNPELTRFTQPDTIIQDNYNPQNLNRYSYVMNNPLKYTDPTGQTPFLPETNLSQSPKTDGVEYHSTNWSEHYHSGYYKSPTPKTYPTDMELLNKKLQSHPTSLADLSTRSELSSREYHRLKSAPGTEYSGEYEYVEPDWPPGLASSLVQAHNIGVGIIIGGFTTAVLTPGGPTLALGAGKITGHFTTSMLDRCVLSSIGHPYHRTDMPKVEFNYTTTNQMNRRTPTIEKVQY